MKPSKFVTVKGRKAWFLLPGFAALTWKGYAYCKTRKMSDSINSTENINSQLKSHETIHIRQAESMKNSWFRFYIRYAWEWVCNIPLITINKYAPYLFMPIEMEAYLNHDNWDYCMHGEVHQWKEFEKLKLKERRKLAKEFYSYKPMIYITRFLKDKMVNKR